MASNDPHPGEPHDHSVLIGTSTETEVRQPYKGQGELWVKATAKMKCSKSGCDDTTEIAGNWTRSN